MGSFFGGKEGLNKKDDDHRPARAASTRPQWRATTRTPPRKTLKRLAIVLALGAFVYLFIANLPTDVPVRDRRRPVYQSPSTGGKLQPEPKSSKPNTAAAESAPPAGYNGPITFRELGSTLQAVQSTGGNSHTTRNVLFTAASLKSAAILLPMACQMGSELKNNVHFTLMGGSEIDLEELRIVNGISESCNIMFHDARPDFAASSSNERLKRGARRALFHIINFMHPQAVFVDASGVEEDYFLAGIKKQAPASGAPLIELPENAHSRFAWVTKLDSTSLGFWDKISVDIVIQAPSGTSGKLIHLLKSLSAADFSAGLTPHLTIELPHDVDRATTEFLKNFQWPPGRRLDSRPRQLTLRHRIARSKLTEEESSVRFLESFWPANPRNWHVLVLSPQAQLSPRFFHYLKYAVLEYLYSGAARTQEWDTKLFGISLDLPSKKLNSLDAFTPPSRKGAETKSDDSTPFLWQAPNSNAALYTGQKWVELHAFVSNFVEYQHKTQPLPAFFTDKLVSKKYPSWLEHALRLSRARGYWTLYPSAETAASLATVHNELYRAPEEYEKELPRDMPQDKESPLSAGAPFESLPGRGLPFEEMPLLLWDGKEADLGELDKATADYAGEFRRAVGGCEALAPADLLPRKSMKDLFCMKENQ